MRQGLGGGHTGGGMLSHKNVVPEAEAVLSAMKAVHFNINGSSCTWYGFWFGSELMVSVFLLFSAVAAWQLDKVRPESWPAVSVIVWALVASHAANSVLSWVHFFVAPGLLSALIKLLLAVGALRKSTRPNTTAAMGTKG